MEGGEKTERATPRKRQDAEREGNIPRSHELSAAAGLVAATLALGSFSSAAIGRETVQIMRVDFGAISSEPLHGAGATALVQGTAVHFLLALAPFALVMMTTAAFVGLVQGRGVISTARITPKFTNLDPRNGFKRIFSMRGLFTLGKAMAKLIVLGSVAWMTLHGSWSELTGLGAVGVFDVMMVIKDTALRLVFHVGLAYLVIAGADYAFEVYRYEKDLRMSKYEVKREMKENDGDPMIKSRIRALMRALTRKRMLRAVATADVVVTNPTHVAVALRYDVRVAGAPVVVAMGERKLAERIKAIAAQHNVPCIENVPLARALLATSVIGYPIPAALYAAVAEVLAFVYRRRGAMAMAQ